MSSVADKLGFGPQREVIWDHDSSRYIIRCTAPRLFNPMLLSVDVVLTPPQFANYIRWQRQGYLIQEVLSDISPNEREKLMTGLAPGAPAWQVNPTDHEIATLIRDWQFWNTEANNLKQGATTDMALCERSRIEEKLARHNIDPRNPSTYSNRAPAQPEDDQQ